MNRVAIAALIGSLALAACGGASATPPATARTTTQATAAAPATQAAATQAAATAAATSAAAAAGPARKIAISATNSLYSISTLEVKAGEKIEFALTNTGDEKHNLVAMVDGTALVSPDIEPGQAVSWTWTAPAKPTTFKFICAYHKDVPPVAVTVK